MDVESECEADVVRNELVQPYNWTDSSAMASTWVFSGQARESEEYFNEELGTHRLVFLYATWLHRSELGTCPPVT